MGPYADALERRRLRQAAHDPAGLVLASGGYVVLPPWVLQLVRGLERYENEHPKQ
ncbi:hypothetical protein [Micromonospora craterilacus]|uniref:hypothetical protein n=1 Tax=Micromonospora craterilacus TaxID=1655439 RepID=UPI001313EBDE|nr:hypothetical protein [Micromonospora craterilacus]